MSNDTFISTSGNDSFDGGDGDDTLSLSGNAAGYRISWLDGKVIVQDIDLSDGNTGKDTLLNIETLSFADQSYQIGEAFAYGSSADTPLLNGPHPAVTALNDGGYVSVSGGDGGLSTQRYDASGHPVGAAIPVKSAIDVHFTGAVITTLGDGSYVIAWSDNSDGDYDIYARHYDSAGNPLGSAARVNTNGTEEEQRPAITALANGDYVITWDNYDEGPMDVYAQRYNSSGAKVGTETRVNASTGSVYHFDSTVAALAGGGYVVGWIADGTSGDIHTQRFNSSGAKVGSEAVINNTFSLHEYTPTIAGLPNGGYVLAYGTSVHDDGAFGIIVQRFNSNGTAVGSAVRLSPDDPAHDSQKDPDIAVLQDGSYVVTWNSIGPDEYEGFAVYAQRFAANGNKLGTESRIDLGLDPVATDPSITTLANGDYLIVWEGDNGSYAQRFKANGTPVENVLQITGTDDSNTINAGTGQQLLRGMAGDDILNGGGDADVLMGDQGNDMLSGGSGSDIFVFSTALNSSSNVDILADYSTSADTIHLDRTIFTKFANIGVLAKGNFRANVDGVAMDSNDYIVYETDTGILSYDADGNGVGVKVQIATIGISTHPTLNSGEFVVI